MRVTSKIQSIRDIPSKEEELEELLRNSEKFFQRRIVVRYKLSLHLIALEVDSTG